jgi:myo-inositol catabolism protein IolS
LIYKELPHLGIKVPGLIFGGASLSGEGGGYGFGEMSEKNAEELIQTAWENGITVFDTAPIYGFGMSEERLGKYLPKEAMVITKSGVDWHPSQRVNMTNDPEVTRKMLHESLKRLNRSMIDFYMIHWPDKNVDIRRPLEVLVKAKEEGKIRFIGLCNTNKEDLTLAREMTSIDALQSELNLFNQKPFDDLGDEWKNTFSMSWGTFDKGILTGRVTKDRKFSKEDCRSWAPWWNKKEVAEKIEKTEVLKSILDDYRISLQEFCIHFNLEYYGLSSALIGFKTSQDLVQLTSNLQSKLMRERIEEVLDRWKTQS